MMKSVEQIQAELKAIPVGENSTLMQELIQAAIQLRTTATQEALVFAQQAQHIAEQLHDPERIAECLNLCALCHWHMSMYKQALEEAFSALRLYEHRDDIRGIAATKNTIGMIYRNLSDYNQALSYHNQALDIVEQTSHSDIIAETLTNIGIIHHRLANYAEALKYHHSSLNICLQGGYTIGQSTAYHCTGDVYFDLKDYYQAINNYQHSLSLSESTGDRWSEAIALESIGMVCEKMRDLDEAMIFFRRSLNIRQEISDKYGQASALFHLGMVFHSGKNDKQAINFFKLSLSMRREVHDRFGEAETLLGYGKVYFNESSEYHNSILAVEQFQSALKIANELGAKQLMFRAHKLLSKCYKQIDMHEKALYHYEQFYAIRKNVGGDEASLKIKQMEIKIATEVSDKEAEIQRLKNVELATMMKEVEELNDNLLELNKEKSEFLSIVSHDLKNPIAGILLNVSTIERYAGRMSTEELLKQVRAIGETAERMKGIVHRLLDARSIEHGEFEFHFGEVNCTLVVDAVVSEYRTRALSKSIKFDVHHSPTDDFIMADASAFRECLSNLVSNAVKYSPMGKKIMLRTVQKSDTILRIEVVDEGPGITKEDIPNLFKKFGKTNNKVTGGESSTGLGLSIVKRMIEAMGGTVGCTSEVGKGSIFYIDMPRIATPVSRAMRSPSEVHAN